MFSKVFIPYKGYWSSPFSRWQGSFQNENSIVLGRGHGQKVHGVEEHSPPIPLTAACWA